MSDYNDYDGYYISRNLTNNRLKVPYNNKLYKTV